MPCRIHGCNARKKIDEYGYCPAHKEKHASENNAAEFVKINDKLDKVLEELKGVKEENSMLRKENATLRAKVNLNFFSNDALNQYGRKEIFRIHDYPEPVVVPSPASDDDGDGSVDSDNPVEADNSVEAVLNVAQKLGIMITEEMIQRCHRVGKKRKKPRSIIVKLKCWSKRMEFIKAKRKLRNADWSDITPTTPTTHDSDVQPSIFITEDLTHFRLKMLHYIKNKNKVSKQFDRISTRNGNITCREAGTNKWHTIKSTEDFLEAGIELDEDEFPEVLF